MLRYLTAGESHGPVLTAIIDGLPAGLSLETDYINIQLSRRQSGYGRGGRMKIESDQVRILSGVRGGFTLGSPLTLQVENKDWANWSEVMSPGLEARLDQRVVTRPRPGHADLTGALKYGHRDIRNVLERASARETAVRVAVGAVARRLLEELGAEIVGHVVQIGSVKANVQNLSIQHIKEGISRSEVLCAEPEVEKAMIKEIENARQAGDSLGGVFQIQVSGLPPGLGSYTQWDRKLDGRLSGALMSIQAIKGVEVGLGFEAAGLPGSRVHDEIFYRQGRGFYRHTNGAGGLEGGMTNGSTLVVRAAMKPIPTLYKPLKSVDLLTGEPFEASVERSDVCAVPAACVVGEAVVAWVLAVAYQEKFGGDTLAELKNNLNNYLLSIKTGLPK